MSATSGPHGTAVAVTAKNIPPECFLNAATVLKEIISLSLITHFRVFGGVFFCTRLSMRKNQKTPPLRKLQTQAGSGLIKSKRVRH